MTSQPGPVSIASSTRRLPVWAFRPEPGANVPLASLTTTCSKLGEPVTRILSMWETSAAWAASAKPGTKQGRGTSSLLSATPTKPPATLRLIVVGPPKDGLASWMSSWRLAVSYVQLVAALANDGTARRPAAVTAAASMRRLFMDFLWGGEGLLVDQRAGAESDAADEVVCEWRRARPGGRGTSEGDREGNRRHAWHDTALRQSSSGTPGKRAVGAAASTGRRRTPATL